jgi:hypothetical protein
MAKTIKVTVAPGTGNIVITSGGGEALRYKEVDGVVDVPAAELDLFLTHVSGSSVAPPATPAAKE